MSKKKNSVIDNPTKEFVKFIRRGQPTKYDPDKHLQLLYNIFNVKGEGIPAFCADALISQATFHNWLNNYTDFREAYEIVINMSARKWELYPLQNKDVNFPYWSSIMRTRFKYGKLKIKNSQLTKDVTPLSRIDVLWRALEEGDLSHAELGKVIGLISAEANIKANISMENDLITERESREQLIEKVYAIKQVIEYTENKNTKKL